MKRNGSMVGQIAHALMLGSMLAWSVMPAGRLLAAPSGESVQAGSADFVRNGDLTQITASNGAIINYDSFNIGAAETVQFIQPDSTSRVLNRITGADPTQIDGTLLSNGIVYIVNPAGVYFGQGALVNVGGIYTGAAQLSNADFLAGIDHFSDVSGNIVNRGTINGSLVALIGQHVANYGTISAPDGMVTMLAGDDVVITGRDRHFSVRITGMGAEAHRQIDGSATAAVENHGTINATGGKVVWGAGDVYAMGIFNDGAVKAATVEATATGSNAVIGGTIDASSATGKGGDVAITAEHVAVTGTIDASGATGGGSIKIGGDLQGSGDMAHAQSTLITSSAYLLANAMTGEGGKVIVWSDGNTFFYGTIEASGASGGGLVETSGHYLDTVGGSVIASGGTWLLDPFNVELGDFGGAGNSAGGAFDAGNPNTWTASASPSQVDVGDVVASLDAGTSVTINTSGGGAEAGDITVSAAIAKTAGADATLTFNADNDININAAVSSTSNLLNVALNAAGDVTVGSAGSVATNGGDFDVASATYTGTGAVTTSGGAVTITTSGNQVYAAGAINAGSGDVALTTTGAGNINEAVVEADTASEAAEIITTGHVTLRATGTGSIGSNPTGGNTNILSTPLFDIDAPWVDARVTAGSGNIQLKDLAVGGVDVNKLSVNNGFVRFDSTGAMTLEDNAVVVANASAGAGFAWLVSGNGINAANPGNLVITTGASSNLRIDAVGDVGTLANPLVVDTTGLFVLMDRGDFADNPGGTSSFYAENQRLGTTNIVSMMIDSGDAQVTAPGNINVSDFSDDFDTSFLGGGDLVLVSTTGSITAPSTITLNGGTADFTSAGDIGTSGTPIDIIGAGGLSMVANAGAGNVFLTGETISGPLTDIDPATFGGLVITSANTHVNITSDGTDITFTQLQLPVAVSPFELLANSLTGDIHILDNAIVIPMTAKTDVLSISADAGSIDLGSAAITSGAGTVKLFALGAGADITISNAGPNIISDATNGGRVELTADNSIGASGSPVQFQYTREIVLDVNQNIYVKHDNTTDISLLSVAADPDQTGSTPIYSFETFTLESYGDGLLTHILSVNDGSVASLLINDAITTSTGTSYSFTAKTGNLYVDDNGTAGISLFDSNGIGNGGISSGTGNVTLVARHGSVLQEQARDDFNVRTAAVSSTSANLGPVVTVRANTAGDPAVEGSIGGDPTTPENHFNIQNAKRIVLDARDHIAVAGSGQPLELLDITADPAGPGLGGAIPLYDLANFDASFTSNITSNGTHLTVTTLQSTYTFDTAAQGTGFAVRARSGDLIVAANAIQTQLHNLDPLITTEPALPSGVTHRSVRLQADGLQPDSNILQPGTGSILLHDNAVSVLGAGTTGNGTVTLIARNAISEADINTTAKITTAGLVELYADALDGSATADPMIGGTPVTGAANPSLNIAAASLVAQAGMNQMAGIINTRDHTTNAVATGNKPGSINVSNTGNLLVRNVDTWNGNVDIRATVAAAGTGAMTLSDAAIVAGNSGNGSGNGNVTLFAVAGITEAAANTAVHITALGDQITLLANAAIGSSATNGSIGIEAAAISGQVATNNGGFFISDVDTALADGLNLAPATDALLGAIPGIATRNGAISVTTVNDMLLTGKIATTTPNAVTFSTSGTDTSITIDNAGAVSVGVGGISDTGSIVLNTDAVLLDTDAVLYSPTGTINVGEYATRIATLDSTPGNHYSMTATADDGYVLFTGDIGVTDRLSSLSATSPFNIYLGGDVFTSGGTQNYFGNLNIMAVDAHLDDSGTSRSAGIHFHSTVNAYLDAGNGYDGDQGLSVTVNSDGSALDTAGTDPEVPTISFAGNVGNDQPLKWLRLNAYDADGDGLFNNSGAGDIDGRADLPTVATIVVANERADGSTDPNRANPIDWIVTVDEDFSMGQNEKLTAIGSVTINANDGGTLATTDTGLRLSDMNADRTLSLNAGNTAVVLLNSGRTVLAGGSVPAGPDTGILYPSDANGNGALDEFANDDGLDFWARNGIHINNAASVALDVPAGPTVRWYSESAANISGTAGIGSTTTLGYFPFITRTSSLGVTVLDLIPLDARFNLGTIYPPPFPRLDDSIRLALTRHEFLNQLLSMTRDAAGGERLRRVLGNATFDDMAPASKGRLGTGGTDTVLNRIREDMVPIVLHTYESLFYTQTANPDGVTESTPRFDQLRQTLADGIAAYQRGTGAAPSDPIKFRTFFEQTSESPETLATLDALRELYLQMAQLGLTDREWSNAIYALTARITPQGTSPDLIILAALGQSYPAAASAK